MDGDTGYDLMSAVRYGSLERVKSLINTIGLSHTPEWSNGYYLLLAATEKDRTEVIKLLLKSGCRVNEKSASRSKTPLHHAIKNGDLSIVEMLLKEGADIDARDETGKTHLRVAIEQRIEKSFSVCLWDERERQLKLKMEIIELLLKRGANIDVPNDKGVTPLHWAIEKSRDLVPMLLNYGAAVDPRTSETLPEKAGFTPLHCAVVLQRTDVVKMLLHSNADLNVEDAHGRTALHLACNSWDAETVAELLNHGADVRRVCASSRYAGYTPLHFAAMHCINRNAELLLEKGAEIDARAVNDVTPLHVAVETRNHWVPFVKLLISRGASVDVRTKNGKTALRMAVETGFPCFVEAVLDGRPDLDDENNRRCMKSAMKALTRNEKRSHCSNHIGECAKIVEKLHDYGFPIDSEDAKNPRLLHAAVDKGCAGLVESLLKLGADADAAYGTARPIRKAVERSDARIVKSLLRNGADVKDSPDLLETAVLKSNRDIVEILLDHGVNVDARNEDGATALHCTTLDGEKSSVFAERCLEEERVVDGNARADIARLIIGRGADVNARTVKEARTTLHGAAALGDVALVQVLLEYHADVNSADNRSQTPLHLAAANGHAEVVKRLLERNPNVNSFDDNGDMPVDCSRKNEKLEVCEILTKFGTERGC